MTESQHEQLARRLADLFAAFPQVEAVALGGSLTSGAVTDPATDIDLYVFITALVPLEDRQAIVEQMGGASRADMNLNYWDLGDEWFHAPTGIEMDVMFWDPAWVEDLLERVIHKHEASIGYSTAHWHTIRALRPLFDRSGRLARMQALSREPYPEPLRENIIANNYPLLRDIIPSYLHQIEKAVRRGDRVSVNHRVAAFLASYFDILFAHNRVLHPGEKRLIEAAERLCPVLPPSMRRDVEAMLESAGTASPRLVEDLNRLVDGVDKMLGGST